MGDLNELIEIAGVYRRGDVGERLFELTFSYEFEPYGKDNETWEPVWCLRFLALRACWKTKEGNWKPVLSNMCLTFKEPTLAGVINQATAWFIDMRNQGFTPPQIGRE